MALEVILSVAVQVFWGPYITDKLPAPLVALGLVTALHQVAWLDVTPTVGSFSKSGGGDGLSGVFPAPHLPYLCTHPETNSTFYGGHCTGYGGYSWDVIGNAAQLGVILAAIGLIESLMTLQVRVRSLPLRVHAYRQPLCTASSAPLSLHIAFSRTPAPRHRVLTRFFLLS